MVLQFYPSALATRSVTADCHAYCCGDTHSEVIIVPQAALQRQKQAAASLVADGQRSGRFMGVYHRWHTGTQQQDSGNDKSKSILYARPDKTELKDVQQTKANKMVCVV